MANAGADPPPPPSPSWLGRWSGGSNVQLGSHTRDGSKLGQNLSWLALPLDVGRIPLEFVEYSDSFEITKSTFP